MTDQATRVVPAGWYEDPASPAHVRWWNGLAWTEHTAVKPSTPPVGAAQDTAGPQSAEDAAAAHAAAVQAAIARATADEAELRAAETAARIAEARELERQYGINTAEPAAAGASAAAAVYRPSWQDEEEAEPPALRTATASAWFISLWPVFTLVAALAVAYISFYVSPEPRVAGIPIVVAVVVVPLLLVVLWAFTDVRKLREYGHRPSSPLFSLIGPLGYLIARRVRVRGFGPLVTLAVLSVVAIGGPAAALLTGAANPVLKAVEIQQAVSEELIGSGAVTAVSCPYFIESTVPGTLYTCNAVLPDGTNKAVWVSIDTADGDFSFDLSAR